MDSATGNNPSFYAPWYISYNLIYKMCPFACAIHVNTHTHFSANFKLISSMGIVWEFETQCFITEQIIRHFKSDICCKLGILLLLFGIFSRTLWHKFWPTWSVSVIVINLCVCVCLLLMAVTTGIILGIGSANRRRHYYVMPFLNSQNSDSSLNYMAKRLNFLHLTYKTLFIFPSFTHRYELKLWRDRWFCLCWDI